MWSLIKINSCKTAMLWWMEMECSFSTKEIASVLKKTFKMIKLLPSTTARIGS